MVVCYGLEARVLKAYPHNESHTVPSSPRGHVAHEKDELHAVASIGRRRRRCQRGIRAIHSIIARLLVLR